jgi:DNA repair photolyase
MATTPPLFSHEPERPTTRTIALLVKEGGVAALPDAVRRGDAATYQEVTCRSALNPVEGMPFKWTLNPYRGCTHGCHYCFARRYQTQFELGAGDEFSSVIFVKTNLIEILRRELARPRWTREQVALGTATDPYQPIEGHYRLTRGALEALCDSRTPVGLVTKGPMAVRDRDILAELGRRASCTVCFSVPSVDEDAWHALEPGTAHPMQRLRAVRQLVDAGVRAGVLMAPLVPGITTHRAGLERTVKAAADHGAAFIGANVLHLQGGTRDHFLSFLVEQYPHLLPKYARLYRGKYAPKEYASQVYGMLKAIQQRYRLNDRQFAKDSDAEQTRADATASAAPEQVVFSWE